MGLKAMIRRADRHGEKISDLRKRIVALEEQMILVRRIQVLIEEKNS